MQDHKVLIKFSKKGEVRYISHLDLQRLFSRALRRAKLPISISQGFSPHPKISFKRALKLGIESEDEEVSVALKEKSDILSIKDGLQSALPPGIELKEVIYINGR